MKTLKVFILLFFLLTQAPATQAVVLDRIMAVVNGKVLSLLDVEGHLSFFKYPLAKRKDSYSEEEIQKGLKEMIDHTLLLTEAKRFGIENPTNKDVDQKIQSIVDLYPSQNDYKQAMIRHVLIPEDMETMAQEHIMVNQFIEQRIGFFIIILPEEVAKYYAENQDRFQGFTLEEVSEEIERTLFRQKKEERLKHFLSRLRTQTQIQINF